MIKILEKLDRRIFKYPFTRTEKLGLVFVWFIFAIIAFFSIALSVGLIAFIANLV